FKPEEYWKISALVRPLSFASADAGAKPQAKKKAKKSVPPDQEQETDDEGQAINEQPSLPEGSFLTELAEWDGQKFKASSNDQVDPIVAALEGAKYVIAKVEQKDRQEKAPPPFTTSTLQQQASIRLRYTAKRTMMIAQRLYEGLELGG